MQKLVDAYYFVYGYTKDFLTNKDLITYIQALITLGFVYNVELINLKPLIYLIPLVVIHVLFELYKDMFCMTEFYMTLEDPEFYEEESIFKEGDDIDGNLD